MIGKLVAAWSAGVAIGREHRRPTWPEERDFVDSPTLRDAFMAGFKFGTQPAPQTEMELR